MLSGILSYGIILSAAFAKSTAKVTTVTVNGKASHSIPPLLYGQMFEDMNGGDGGIYAELLQNRAFQQVIPNTPPALYAWASINGASINVIADPSPLSNALPNSLELTIPVGTSGQVGFSNEGYWGINVNSSWTYNASFYYKFPATSTFSGNFTVALQSSTGTVYASASIPVSGSTTDWTQVAAQLTPDSSPGSTANEFVVTVDGASASGEKIDFAMFSLFPPTFKGRANGLRVDLAQTLYDMKPSFFRLPGGNNLGLSSSSRWQWNATVGNLIDRPGRMGNWGYINTDGLGLLECLYLCEDMGMEAIMAVWAGYSLGGQFGESIAEDQLTPYIQQAIDQINFVIGDPAASKPAALRASLGHPEPFPLQYVEIGNEDFNAAESYVYRWKQFVNTLSATFPQLKFVATSAPWNPMLDPIPKQYDNHAYNSPGWFSDNAFWYDPVERNGTSYFEGEYGVVTTNTTDIFGNGRLIYPDMQASSSEAAFLTGVERNSDIVFAASYAPLLMNIAGYQGTPNLIAFDASQVYPSTSFYTQQLFSVNRGTEYLPSTLPTLNSKLHWSVTRDTPTSTVIIKIANAGTTDEQMTFELPFGSVQSTGTATVLSGSATASNSPQTPNAVMPVTSQINTGSSFSYTAPAYSVNVLRVKVQ